MNQKIALTKDFELIESIGRGVSSEVYRGLRVDSKADFSQVVAIKIFKSSKFRNKFKNELINLSKLNHPNIVSVKDWGEVDEKFYLVTEYIHGLDLQNALKILDSSQPRLKKFILNQIFEGLLELKRKGIAHGDLKPSNVMLSISGEVKLVDVSFDDFGQVFTTPDFSAPEVLSGIRSGFQGDLYSLGVICDKMHLPQKKLLSVDPGDRFYEPFKGFKADEEKSQLSVFVRNALLEKNDEILSVEFTSELKSPSITYGKKRTNLLFSNLNSNNSFRFSFKVLSHLFFMLIFNLDFRIDLPEVKILKLRSLKAYEYWNNTDWISLPTNQAFLIDQRDPKKKLRFRISGREINFWLPGKIDDSKNIVIDAL